MELTKNHLNSKRKFIEVIFKEHLLNKKFKKVKETVYSIETMITRLKNRLDMKRRVTNIK